MGNQVAGRETERPQSVSFVHLLTESLVKAVCTVEKARSKPEKAIDLKKPIEEIKTTRLCRENSDCGKSKGTAPVVQREYKETIKLFAKMLVTISLCETSIMILLHILPLKSHWAVIVDPILLTFLSTPILYWLLVRPVWHSLGQRNRAVEALSKERNKAQTYLDIVGVALVALDSAGRVTLVNRKGSEILGRNEGEILGKNWLDNFVPETERKRTEEFLEQVMAKDTAPLESFEGLILTRDCGEKLMSWHVTALHDESGNVAGALVSGEDITGRRMMQEKLQQSERRYRSFVQNFQGIVYQGHLDFVPVFFHGAVEEITGFKESELVAGKPRWDQVIHPDDLAEVFKSVEEIRTMPGYLDEREYRIIRKDKQTRWVHELIQNVCDSSGKPNLVEGAIYDITERKQMEEDLRQHREHLEQLVGARTTELTKANEQLQDEITRRQKLEKDLMAINEQLQKDIADRRRLERELLNIVERERQRTGQELHDSIGQHLTGITLMIEVLREKLSDKSLEEEVAYAEKTHERIIQATEQTRNLAKGLHPIDLDRHGLASAIGELAVNTEQFFGISCKLTCHETVSTKDASVAMNLYRIAQEAITNAIRHGKTNNIKINLISKDGWLTMTVENDGLDFAAEPSRAEGMGLKIMRHRAEVVNGSLDIRKGVAGGTIVTFVLSNRECQ